MGFTFRLIYNSPLRSDSFLMGIALGLGLFDTIMKKVNTYLLCLVGAVYHHEFDQ